MKLISSRRVSDLSGILHSIIIAKANLLHSSVDDTSIIIKTDDGYDLSVLSVVSIMDTTISNAEKELYGNIRMPYSLAKELLDNHYTNIDNLATIGNNPHIYGLKKSSRCHRISKALEAHEVSKRLVFIIPF